MNKVLGRILLVILVVTLIVSMIPAPVQAFKSSEEASWYAKFHPALLSKIKGMSDDTVLTLMVRLQELPPSIAEKVKGHHDLAVKALKDWARLTQSKVIPRIRAMGGVVLNTFWLDNLILVKAPLRVFKELSRDYMVTEILENFEVHLLDAVQKVPVKPSQEVESWGIFKIRAPDAWAMGYTGEGIRICVLDTGVDISHPALAGKMLTLDPSSPYYPGGWMEWDSNGNPVLSEPHDTHGHGTHTSGTALGGDTENILIGVAPGATLMHGLVLPSGSGTFAQVMAGMEWTVDPYYIDPDTGELVPTGLPAHVVSMSWGASGYYQNDLLPAVEAMLLADVIPVAAIGNDGPYTSSNPGNIWGVIGVGATDQNDNVASWSSGEVVSWPSPPEEWPFFDMYPSTYVKPDVSAPGVGITSAVPGGGYEAWSGTSMATPHVSGTVALILQAAGWTDFSIPDLPEKVYLILNATAIDLGDPGQDIRYGWGRIDAAEAVALARQFAKKSGVEGFVYDNVDHSPIPWATVTVLEINKTVKVNGSGYFRIPLDPGTYHLLFEAWGYEPQTIVVNVTLLNGTIAGIVTDALTGQPIQGAFVEVTELNLTVVTDTNGSFSISVEPGTYHLVAWATGYQMSPPQEVTVDENETVFVFFALLPAGYGSIHGWVFDAETGAPIVNATVVVDIDSGLVVNFTDENGYYELNDIIAGNHTVTVFKPGYKPASTWVFVEPNVTKIVNFTLSPIPPSIVVLGNVRYQDAPHLAELLSTLGYPVVSYDDITELFQDWITGNVYPKVIVIDHYHSDSSTPTWEEFSLLLNMSLVFNVSLVFLGTSYAGATGIYALYEYHDQLISLGFPAVTSYEYDWPSAEYVKVYMLNPSSPVFDNVIPVNDSWFYLADLDQSVYADYYVVEFNETVPVNVLAVVVDESSNVNGTGVAYWIAPSGVPWFYLSSWGESYWMQYLEPGSDGLYSNQTTQVLLNAVKLAFMGETNLSSLRLESSLLVEAEKIIALDNVEAEVYTYVEVYLDRLPYGYVAGHVEGSDGVILSNAVITVVGTPVTATTDENGNFNFWLPAGTYELMISAPGYATAVYTVTVNVNETTDLDTVVLQRVPRIAILYDYSGQIKSFIEENLGWYAKDYSDIDQLVADLETGFYDAVIHAGYYYAPMPSQDQFLSLLNVIDELKLGAMFLDQWDVAYQYPDIFGYGIRCLNEYLGDPAVRSTGDVYEPLYLLITQSHPIFKGYKPGDLVEIMYNPGSYGTDYAYFKDFSGETIGQLVFNGQVQGDAIAWKVTESGARWLLMASFAPEEYQNMQHWTIDALNIFLNGIKWLAMKPVTVTLEQVYLHVGDTAVVHISDAPADTVFNITLDGEFLGQVTTDANGTATFTFTVPVIPGGKHLVEAISVDELYYGSADLVILAKIMISPTELVAPGMVTVEATGLLAGQTVQVYLDGNYLSFVTADKLGTFTVSLNIPLVASGTHYLRLVDPETGEELASQKLSITSQLDIIEDKIDNISVPTDKLDEILNELSNVNSKLDNILGILNNVQGDVASILTDTGEIKVKLDELNMTLIDVITSKTGELYAVLNTTKGIVLAKLEDVIGLINGIDNKITSLSGRIDEYYQNITATLQEILNQVSGTSTKLSTLEGKVTSLQQDVDMLKSKTQSVSEEVNKTKESASSASSSASTATMISGGAIVLSLIALALPFLKK